MLKIWRAHQKQKRKVNKKVKSNRSHPRQRCQNLIRENRAQKVLFWKVCVLWLPQYFRYSIDAKQVESTRTGSDRSFTVLFTYVLTILLCFKKMTRKENKEWKEKDTVETKKRNIEEWYLWFLVIFLKQSKNGRKLIATIF